MTAEAFVDLVQARRGGLGCWSARCPAHEDSSPSLSIRAGSDGRVLLHCFAGCSLAEILAKLKLSRRDLFPGPPLTREQLAKLQSDRDAREAVMRQQRAWLAVPCDNERRFQAAADALGAKLALLPQHDAEPIAAAYHHALERVRWWQAEGERREALARFERAGVTR